MRWAIALRDWLPLVLQSVEPFMSEDDIDKGSRWFNEISRELDASDFGIVCVTRENLDAPWINFEAGALSKSVVDAHVIPLVQSLSPGELPAPLGQFNAATTSADDVFRVLRSINGATQKPISDTRLRTTFDRFWSELEGAFEKAKQVGEHPVAEPVRSMEEMLEEICLRSDHSLGG